MSQDPISHDLVAGSRVVVAMSGGVDSSCVAALLAEAGHEVVGITLQLYDQGRATGGKSRATGGKTCCAGQDIRDARAVAERLGIDHYVLDFEDRFRTAVIDDFAASYAVGRTPLPCVRCNQRIKFAALMDIARDLGAAALATGHYVRRLAGPAGPELHQAADAARDQSYFLFATTCEQLEFLRFPLGELTKAGTRELAARFALPVAAKPDSQDICFVPSGSYARVVEALRPEAALPGDIVDRAGRVLGRHAGIGRYTVGQRRGLAVAAGERLYVAELEPETRRVVVAPRRALACAEAELGELNWLDDRSLGAAPLAITVKHRAQEPAVPASIRATGDGQARLAFAAPQTGVAPGQACVLYRGTRVLGGGWIERAPLLER